jgi:colanic acid biosynthesis glycosyl transferase WcaI
VLKILILGLNFHPEITGIGRYTGELAAYLSAQGHQVRVITAPPYYPYWKVQAGYRGWHYQKETWRGVEVQRCPLWVPRRPTGYARLLHLFTFTFSSLPVLITQLLWKPTIVLCVAPALMNAPFALAFARLIKAKAWLHIQDFELDAASNLKMLRGFQYIYPFVRLLERFILVRFDRVSTISENMRLLCIKKGVRPERTFLLKNWVDAKNIYPLPDFRSLRAKFNIPSQIFVALYHGNMGHKQGLEVLLEAAHFLVSRPEILLVLCGDGPAKQKLVKHAASLFNVCFLELQPEEKLYELVNLADAHLLPQLANAADLVMPSKLSTMLASGKPVIAGANPGTQISQVLSSIGVVVQPENAAALAEAVIALYENPLERLKLGKLGRAYACQYLDKEIILSRLQSLLQNNIFDFEHISRIYAK